MPEVCRRRSRTAALYNNGHSLELLQLYVHKITAIMLSFFCKCNSELIAIISCYIILIDLDLCHCQLPCIYFKF